MASLLNADKCYYFVVLILLVALSGKECSSQSCTYCLFGMIQYADAFGNAISLLEELQDSTTYTGFCSAFDQSNQCLTDMKCSAADGSLELWFKFKASISLLCSAEFRPVLAYYSRTCYLLPNVSDCILRAWNIANSPPPNTSQAMSELNQCLARSTPLCNNASAVNLLNRVLQTILPSVSPSVNQTTHSVMSSAAKVTSAMTSLVKSTTMRPVLAQTGIEVERQCVVHFESNCIQCIVIHLLPHVYLVQGSTSIFAALRNTSVYEGVCCSYDAVKTCFANLTTPCSDDQVPIGQWVTVTKTLDLLCSDNMITVVPDYARTCYVLPAVDACISQAFILAQNPPETYPCSDSQIAVQLRQCFDDAVPLCNNTQASDLLSRLLKIILPTKICPSTGPTVTMVAMTTAVSSCTSLLAETSLLTALIMASFISTLSAGHIALTV